MNSSGEAHLRLEQLYEITKLFASFESVDQSFDPALHIVIRTLPLRSAILIEEEAGHSKTIVWISEGQDAGQMRAVREHVAEAFTYLVGAASAASTASTEQAGRSTLPRQPGTEGNLPSGLIVIPLVVANRPPFGALQLELVHPITKSDLMFVNAIGNQLAIALDRDRAWRRDVTRREHAEEGQEYANARRGTAERERIIAESSKDKFQELADEAAEAYSGARKAVSVREQILAVVSHDLRNPLSTILMATSALAKSGAALERPAAISLAVERIERAANRMRRLIEDLLDFVSIETGHLAIKRQPQDPGPLLEETVANFEGAAHDKHQRLTATVAAQLPKLECDRDRLLQVLANLVGNAIKSTAAGGQITLRVDARGNELLFAVADNGPGIVRADLRHLFERYWRSGEAQYKGTGLGLSIARGIVEAHGGKIWAESEPGHGATFLFTIPATAAAVPTGKRTSP